VDGRQRRALMVLFTNCVYCNSRNAGTTPAMSRRGRQAAGECSLSSDGGVAGRGFGPAVARGVLA
jgi:hypothetical protein